MAIKSAFFIWLVMSTFFMASLFVTKLNFDNNGLCTNVLRENPQIRLLPIEPPATEEEKGFHYDTEMYKKSFLNCSSVVTKEHSFVPKRLLAFTPRKPFKECGTGNLLHPSVDKLSKGVWMLFVVKSAPGNIRLRQSIRETWGTVQSVKGSTFLTIFLVSRTTSYEEDLLREENDEYGDILQCDHEDTYHNLTTKVLSGFRWLLASKYKATHVTFCDDDVTMNIASIYYFFTKMKEKREPDSIICGYLHSTRDTQTPQRDIRDKWYISKELYDKALYPSFCHGAMWTLPVNFIHDIYCAAEVTNLTNLHIDDVLVTGILRHKIMITADRIRKPQIVPGETFELMKYVTAKEKKNEVLKEYWIIFYRQLMESYYSNETYYGKDDFKINPMDIAFKFPNKTPYEILEKKWNNKLDRT